jgi:hypothetical protein
LLYSVDLVAFIIYPIGEIMIKHVVMFKLKNNNGDNLSEAVSALENMKDKIPTLRFIEVGVDITKSERSCDIVLTTHFDDIEGLKVYVSHSVHQPVIQTMRNLCSTISAVDYEV